MRIAVDTKNLNGSPIAPYREFGVHISEPCVTVLLERITEAVEALAQPGVMDAATVRRRRVERLFESYCLRRENLGPRTFRKLWRNAERIVEFQDAQRPIKF